MEKRFHLPASAIRPLVTGHGGCYATDRITVDGARVGYLYREAPGGPHDSGWRFFAGSESDEYVNNPNNVALYDVNTIANYDPEIIPLLASPPGSAFAREGPGNSFVPV
jgi:hypothetical protein